MISSHDVFLQRYAAALKKASQPDAIVLTFGAPHEARLTLAGAMDASDAWRDDTYLSIVWRSDPRELGDQPIDVRFVFGVTETTAQARPGHAGEVSLKHVKAVERRRTTIGNEPVERDNPFYPKEGLTCTGDPSWGVVGPTGTRLEVMLGEKLLAKKRPVAGARVLRSGKLTIAGVSVAQLEIGASGWAPFELPLPSLVAQTSELGLKNPSLFVLHTPTQVEVTGKRPPARRVPPEPTFDEAKLLTELVRSMNDSAIDSFSPGVRFVSAERVHEHVVLRYEHEGRPGLARAHRPEPLDTRAALREAEEELSRQIGRDTSEI